MYLHIDGLCLGERSGAPVLEGGGEETEKGETGQHREAEGKHRVQAGKARVHD